MATKAITDSIITSISKGPLVVFVMFGVGFWQLSNMTDQQIATIGKLAAALNNPVGAVISGFVGFLLVYALMLFPVGRFVSKITTGFTASVFEAQQVHNQAQQEHITASKEMYHRIGELEKQCNDMHACLNKFYGGENG